MLAMGKKKNSKGQKRQNSDESIPTQGQQTVAHRLLLQGLC
jgi:hypothetical protein